MPRSRHIELAGAAVKHRHSRHVKSSDCDRDAVAAARPDDIEGARILVRLDGNECKRPKIAVTAKPLDQSIASRSIATSGPRTWRSAQSAAMT
jgi:hypothetical protein